MAGGDGRPRGGEAAAAERQLRPPAPGRLARAHSAPARRLRFLHSTPAPAVPAAPAPTAPAPVVDEPAKPNVPAFSFSSDDAYEEVPVSQMRKVIARRLGESKFSAPHFYLTVEINMAKVIKMRTRLNEVAPIKISFNDLVVKAAAVALRSHPAINSSWMGDTIRVNSNVNVGVAVAVDDGLLVPVIRHADMKTLSQINVEVRELAGKARKRKLQPQDQIRCS